MAEHAPVDWRSCPSGPGSTPRRRHGDLCRRRRATGRHPCHRRPCEAVDPEALAALKAEGIQVVMPHWRQTGSRPKPWGKARHPGHHEVLPEEKSAVVNRHKEAGRVVAMAGDGVNDAPPWPPADVGIAMGSGTDVADRERGVTLLKGDLTGIVRARRLRRPRWATSARTCSWHHLPRPAFRCSGGCSTPSCLLLSPVIAAAAMALSSVSVIANASRLRFVRL